MKKMFTFFHSCVFVSLFLQGVRKEKKKKIANPLLEENYLDTLINNKPKYSILHTAYSKEDS